MFAPPGGLTQERTAEMVGITSIGAYLPVYRLEQDEIARMWAGRSAGGARAVAGYDEDTVTMAVAAALDCLKRGSGGAGGLSLATTTPPYREKQSAAIVAAVADMPDECHTADFTDSLRAATIALKGAVDAVKAGSAKNILVVAADSRPAAVKGALEQNLGDGAAALMIGSQDVIAEIEGSYSIFNDFTDFWRTESDTFIRSAEGRFIDEVGYLPTMQAAVTGLLKKSRLEVSALAKVIYYAGDARQHAALARRLKLDKKQVQDPLYGRIGNTGTAAVVLMLAAALETAEPGDRILLAGYGDGADVISLRVTDAVKHMQGKPSSRTSWPAGLSAMASTSPGADSSRWRPRRCRSARRSRCRHAGGKGGPSMPSTG